MPAEIALALRAAAVASRRDLDLGSLAGPSLDTGILRISLRSAFETAEVPRGRSGAEEAINEAR